MLTRRNTLICFLRERGKWFYLGKPRNNYRMLEKIYRNSRKEGIVEGKPPKEQNNVMKGKNGKK